MTATVSTATEPETVNADDLRDEAEKAKQAADQLAARIKDLLPETTFDGDRVMEWTPESREAIAKLIDDPPRNIGDIPDDVIDALTDGSAVDLVIAAIRRQLDNALRRDDRVRKAERKAAKFRHLVVRRTEEMKSAKTALDKAKDDLDAALYVLQVAVRDQASGQNALPMPDGESPEENGASDIPENIPADPAATAPVADLDLTAAQTEAFVDAGMSRVADVIAWAGDERRRKVKGIGPQAFEAVREKLIAWREANPMPDADS